MRYECHRCHTENVKLWRDSAGERLLCGVCVCSETGRDYTKLDKDGTLFSQATLMRSDRIGFYIPAIPSGNTFWGYSSAPAEAVEWWKALPLEAHECRNNDLPVCPYCGHEERDYSDLLGEGEHELECGACDQTYVLEVVVTVTYTSRVEMPK